MDNSNIKEKIAFMAVDELVRDGMKIGLGTGSTAVFAVRRIMERRKAGDLKNILAVPTSLQTEIECRSCNIPFRCLNDPEIDASLDLTIDGADEIDPEWNLIKGGGGALLLEKIIAGCSARYAIIAHASKQVKYLGETHTIPVEVYPGAMVTVSRKLEALGAKIELRMAASIAGPAITKQGNILFDISMKEPFFPGELEITIKSIPGVIDVGLFTIKVTDLFIGYPDGQVKHSTREYEGLQDEFGMGKV